MENLQNNSVVQKNDVVFTNTSFRKFIDQTGETEIQHLMEEKICVLPNSLSSFFRRSILYQLKATDEASIEKEYLQLEDLELEKVQRETTSLGELLKNNLGFKRVFSVIHKEGQAINSEIYTQENISTPSIVEIEVAPVVLDKGKKF